MSNLIARMGGIHFRVLMLVTGLAATLMAAQLVTDTVVETRESQHERLSEALSMTNVVARSLEKQFDYLDLTEIESILASVRTRANVKQVIAVDRDRTFYLDGDLATPALLSIDNIPEQARSLETASVAHSIIDETITVAEPLLRNGEVIGSIAIKFYNPDFAAVAVPIILSNLYFSVPILLLGLMFSTLLVRQITGPLHRLSESTASITAGDLDCDVPIEGPREIRQLGSAFSEMISKLKHNIEQVYELAYVDKTTKLPNREFFRKELTRAIRRSVRHQSTGALLFVDLDGFKKVNDTHGHDSGDDLLGQFSDRLANVLRAEDLIAFKVANAMSEDDGSDQTNDGKNRQMLARLGGDEFTVLLSDLREATDAATVSQRIIDAVSEPFVVNGSEIRIGASIGIAIFPRDGSDYQTILKSADLAMYQAKEEGKNTYRYYSEELNQEASRRMVIERDLRVALEDNDQLELYYQPKIETKTGEPRSVEALIRWKHPERGMIQPLEFINVAEDCGLILPLGKWILEEACNQINRFEELGLDLSIAVNISTAQFSGADLSKVVMEVLSKTGANAQRLELELTESMAMQNPEMALHHIKTLKGLGIRFAIDDFGTGYSNLSQLSQLPFDVFKIDRSFVDMLTNSNEEHGQIIVRTILAMANSLNYETVAEGVETIEQLEFMAEYGCTFAQGYYFAKPMPEKDFLEWHSGWQDKEKSGVMEVSRQVAAA
ncbi:MAG: EAL domain-containing protein [Pseudomonadota bacterium]